MPGHSYPPLLWSPAMNNKRSDASSALWKRLEDHFRLQAQVLQRFAEADPSAVLRMWRTGTNEFGQSLSAFEREALVERHCVLFGHWPNSRMAALINRPSVMRHAVSFHLWAGH